MEISLKFIIGLREDTNNWEIIFAPVESNNESKMRELQMVYEALSKVDKSIYKKLKISETIYG
jgi:hypothetical protein